MILPQPVNTEPLSKNRRIENTAIILLGIGSAVAVVGIIVFAWNQQRFESGLKADSTVLGNMGSFLSGTVGITWSLASVILFYLALKEQREDIKTNRKAFDLQLLELEQTRMVYVEQSIVIKTQVFENSFFELLKLYAGTAKDIRNTPFTGDSSRTFDMFELWKQTLDNFSYGTPTDDSTENEHGLPVETRYKAFGDETELQQALDNYYMTIYRHKENVFNHYFRQLYHIFKYIYLSKLIDDDRKQFYASLVRAQLSQNELHAIVFNSLIPEYGKSKFLFLIKQYNITKNFNPDNIPSPIVWRHYTNEMAKSIDPFIRNG